MSSTLADRSGAGRVETHASAKNEDSRVAAVAKQDGFGGMVLQTKLFGDILSTVEYTANEKKRHDQQIRILGTHRICMDTFHGIWSLSRCDVRPLIENEVHESFVGDIFGRSRCFTAWAYTAEGIITVMHKYKLEAVIPIAIIAFVLMAVLHMRSTKNRRLAELFEDTLLDSFHDEVQDKYGQRQEQP